MWRERGNVLFGQRMRLMARWVCAPIFASMTPLALGQDVGDLVIIKNFDEGPATPTFTDVTNPDMADETGHSRGVAWGDFDQDGDIDLYVTNWTHGANRLHVNNGDGTFTWATGTPLDDVGFGGRAIWADYDNDGDLDLYLVNSGANRLYRNDGGIQFTDITNNALADGGLSRCAAWGDFNNDGFVDMYLTVSGVNVNNDVNVLFLNLQGNALSLFVNPVLELPERVGRGISWADYDNDGDLDMYVANGGPPDEGPKDPPVNDSNALFRNDGGAFVEVTPPQLLLQDNSRSVTWADYDNDGDLDLLVTTGSSGANILFKNVESGFAPVSSDTIGAGGRTRDAAWGDFDNDGDLDLYLSRLSDNRLLRNDGDDVFTNVTTGELGNAANGRGVAWADYDDDGDLDLFNATTMANTLFRNDTHVQNDWLKVKLQGTISNRDGIGARIYVRTGERTQMREIAAGEGYLSQRPMVQHFGLGQLGHIDEVEVVWPASGRTQQFLNVIPNQTMVITEPMSSTDLNGDGEVDGADLAILLSAVGTESPLMDVSSDGVVDGIDVAMLLSAWGNR